LRKTPFPTTPPWFGFFTNNPPSSNHPNNIEFEINVSDLIYTICAPDMFPLMSHDCVQQHIEV
jgi:hypothetical protein